MVLDRSEVLNIIHDMGTPDRTKQDFLAFLRAQQLHDIHNDI
jgi:hypothetical protein